MTSSATNATVNRFITVTIATAIIRHIEPQLQSTPFSTTLWHVCKVMIKNDKQALPDAVKAVRHWLGI